MHASKYKSSETIYQMFTAIITALELLVFFMITLRIYYMKNDSNPFSKIDSAAEPNKIEKSNQLLVKKSEPKRYISNENYEKQKRETTEQALKQLGEYVKTEMPMKTLENISLKGQNGLMDLAYPLNE